jgi:predicted small secreted protein
MGYVLCMKIVVLILTALAMNSCNTLIGIGRDTKQGYEWTKSKFQETSEPDPSGAPVY